MNKDEERPKGEQRLKMEFTNEQLSGQGYKQRTMTWCIVWTTLNRGGRDGENNFIGKLTTTVLCVVMQVLLEWLLR